jgi:antitoxin (DNA-binding transcriptional repressor) of toxin-antitoxin stability system
MADELTEAKQRFAELVRAIDPGVVVVIPERATLDAFRISLTRGQRRRFLTVSEDDLLDLVEDAKAAERMAATLRAEIAQL